MEKHVLTKALNICILACVFALGYFIVNLAGTLLHLTGVSVYAAKEEIDKYEVRSMLLTDAMNYVGVCNPEDAARVWAEGLKGRSAAMQYSVMSAVLRAEYAKALEQTFPNWVTGGSSPWIQNYAIIKSSKTGEGSYSFTLRFSTETSTGPAGDYSATVDVAKEGSFWRITKIKADKELDVYTGFVN